MSRPALLLLLLLVAPGAAAESAREEREAVRERLAAQRAATAALEAERGSVLHTLEVLEAQARASTRRVQALERDLTLLRRRLEAAEREEAAAREVLDFQQARVGPRLLGLYRLTRHHALDVLLSARDFASLLWRARAMRATLREDLHLLESLAQARGAQRRAREELERLQEAVGARVGVLRDQMGRAEAQRAALQDVVAALGSEAQAARRVVRELEHAEAELTRLVREMETGAVHGFGALRGRLPHPTEGYVEVGFGRVVNPRFNTVTVQKGLDIRAHAGTPVRAVAEGRVAYAGWLRGYGNLLIVDHGEGYHSLMAHLASLDAPVGTLVSAGQQVGTVGDTGSLKGAYLYFEIRKGGLAVDPGPWLRSAALSH